MFTIDSTIDIAAPLARVRTAITTEAGYRAWLAEDADFNGKQATFRFSQPSETRSVTLEVDRCDGGAVVMTCIAHDNNADWLGTTLAIDVSGTPTGTRVHLTHVHHDQLAREIHQERCTSLDRTLRSCVGPENSFWRRGCRERTACPPRAWSPGSGGSSTRASLPGCHRSSGGLTPGRSRPSAASAGQRHHHADVLGRPFAGSAPPSVACDDQPRGRRVKIPAQSD